MAKSGFETKPAKQSGNTNRDKYSTFWLINTEDTSGEYYVSLSFDKLDPETEAHALEHIQHGNFQLRQGVGKGAGMLFCRIGTPEDGYIQGNAFAHEDVDIADVLEAKKQGLLVEQSEGSWV